MNCLRAFTLAGSLLALVLSCAAPQALALTGRELCQTYASLSKAPDSSKTPSISLGQRLQMRLLPRTLIEPVDASETRRSSGTDAHSRSPKIIFVHLPHGDRDPRTIAALQASQAQVERLELVALIKASRSIDQCEAAVAKYPDQFARISEHIERASASQPALQAEQDHALLEVLKRKLGPFERRGWKVRMASDFFEMVAEIEATPMLRELMIVAHSDETGRIYDARKNIFPKAAFSNLPASVKRLIVYSCHGDQVARLHEADRLSARLEYLYPQTKDQFKAIYSSAVPVAAIRGMLPATRRAPARPESLSSERSCQLRIKMPESRNNLVVTIGDRFAGTIQGTTDTRIPLDCSLLSGSGNRVKIFYQGASARPALSIYSISFRTAGSDVDQELTVKEFMSSQTGNHLLTQGT